MRKGLFYMSDFQRWSIQNALMNPTIVHLAFASIVNVILVPVQNLLPLTTPFITLATLSSYFVLGLLFFFCHTYIVMSSVLSWSTDWSRNVVSAASWRRAGGNWRATADPPSRVWERWRRTGADWRSSSKGQRDVQTGVTDLKMCRKEVIFSNWLEGAECNRREISKAKE